MTFEYTHSKTDFNSSAIKEAYYNSQRWELALVLTGGAAYLYTDVPQGTYAVLTTESSAGRYYVDAIKPHYGPGTYLGYMNEKDSYFVSVDAKTESAYGNVVNMPAWAKPSHNESAKFSGAANDLQLSKSNGFTAVNTFNLYSAPTAPKGRKHVVEFVVQGVSAGEHMWKATGDESVREHTVIATDLEDALRQTNQVAEMLDLSFNIRSVKVVFED